MVAEQIAGRSRRVVPGDLPESYYDFGRYVSKERMLTFWYQLSEVLASRPKAVLEVGVGSRVVAGALRERGVDVTTLDINASLKPTVVGRIEQLDQHFEPNSFDIVLCARVLHHVPFSEFDKCVGQLATVAKGRVVMTLPVDDLRIYASARMTSKPSFSLSVRMPRALKRALLRRTGLTDTYYARLWKIGSAPESTLSRIEDVLKRSFVIEKSYALPEDRSHHLFVLRKVVAGGRGGGV